MNILTEDIAIWRLNLIFQSRGWYVGIYKRGSLKSTKLGRYYIINHFTNEMIDFSDQLTQWMVREFIISPWEQVAGEEQFTGKGKLK
ncbi:hypothetical protein ACXG8J_004053 [Enterobacter ludwigii]